jgi:hypothetical protein
MTRTLTRLASVEITPRSLCIARLTQFDPEESQSIADARADSWRIFADTSREHERIQSTERGREGANPLFRLITEQRNGFRGSDIMGFLREQVSHIGTDLRNSEQSGLVVDHFVKLFRGHLLGSRQIRRQAGIQIARAGAHHQS